MRTLGLIVSAIALAAPAFAGTAFLKHHYVSGQNRICVYDHLGSQYIMTIRATELCPLSLQL